MNKVFENGVRGNTMYIACFKSAFRFYLYGIIIWSIVWIVGFDKVGFRISVAFDMPRIVGSAFIAFFIVGPICSLIGAVTAFLTFAKERDHEKK